MSVVLDRSGTARSVHPQIARGESEMCCGFTASLCDHLLWVNASVCEKVRENGSSSDNR